LTLSAEAEKAKAAAAGGKKKKATAVDPDPFGEKLLEVCLIVYMMAPSLLNVNFTVCQLTCHPLLTYLFH
jgi:hypothetical protein